MGTGAAFNGPANALLLCHQCHRWVESHRSMSYQYGWLVRSRNDPAKVRVFVRGVWVLLDNDGGLTAIGFVEDSDGGVAVR